VVSEQFLGVRWADVGNDSFDGDAAVDGAEAAFGGDGFGKGIVGVGFVK
jgi:hypothetical protein